MRHWMGLAAGLIAAPALGGTVWFSSPQAVVPVGTPILVDVSIETTMYNQFELGTVIIGSDDATAFTGFTYAAEWLAEFGVNAYVPNYALVAYSSAEVLVGGNSLPSEVSFADSLIELGSFAIDTTGMSPGTYSVTTDFMRDFDSQVVYTFGGEGDPIFDALYGEFEFTLTPEPGALAMVVVGLVAAWRRR